MTVRTILGLAALTGALALGSLGCSAPRLQALYAEPSFSGDTAARPGVVVLPQTEGSPRIQSDEQPRIPSAVAVQVTLGK